MELLDSAVLKHHLLPLPTSALLDQPHVLSCHPTKTRLSAPIHVASSA